MHFFKKIFFTCAIFCCYIEPSTRVIVTGPIATGKTTLLNTQNVDYVDMDKVAKEIIPENIRKEIASHLFSGTMDQCKDAMYKAGQLLYDYIIANKDVKFFEVSAFGVYASYPDNPMRKLYDDSVIVYVEKFDSKTPSSRVIKKELYESAMKAHKKPCRIDFNINTIYQSDEYIASLFNYFKEYLDENNQKPLRNKFFDQEFVGIKGKVAVYIGSFDPIHKGHVKIVEHVLNEKIADYVLIFPVYGDDSKQRTDWKIRTLLIQKAFATSDNRNRIMTINDPRNFEVAIQSLGTEYLAVFGEDVLKFYNKDEVTRYFFKNYVMKGKNILGKKDINQTFKYPKDFGDKKLFKGDVAYPMNGHVVQSLTVVPATRFVIFSRPTLGIADLSALGLNASNMTYISMDDACASRDIKKAIQQNGYSDDLPELVLEEIQKMSLYQK